MKSKLILTGCILAAVVSIAFFINMIVNKISQPMYEWPRSPISIFMEPYDQKSWDVLMQAAADTPIQLSPTPAKSWQRAGLIYHEMDFSDTSSSWLWSEFKAYDEDFKGVSSDDVPYVVRSSIGNGLPNQVKVIYNLSKGPMTPDCRASEILRILNSKPTDKPSVGFVECS